MNKAAQFQLDVRRNAETLQQEIKDLYSWQDDIKAKEMKRMNTPPQQDDEPPLRTSKYVSEQASKKESCAAVTNQLQAGRAPPAEQSTMMMDDQARHNEADEWKNRGNNSFKIENYSAAIADYTRAIDIYPDDAAYYSNRALCLMRLERYEESIKDCDAALKVNPKTIKALYRRMQANEFLAHNLDALNDCTKLLELEPNNKEALRSHQRINKRIKDKAISRTGPNFTTPRADLVPLKTVLKTAKQCSNKPLRQVRITEVIGPKRTVELNISDRELDDLFFGACPPFKEITHVNTESVKQQEEEEEQQQQQCEDDHVVAITDIITTAPMQNGNDKPTESEEDVIINKPIDKLAIDADNTNNNNNNNNNNANNISSDIINANVKQSNFHPKSPNSIDEFYQMWKGLAPAEKYKYLSSIDLKRLNSLLGPCLDADTLHDLLQILQDFYLTKKDSNIERTLLAISENSEIPIISCFLEEHTKKVLTKILKAINNQTAEKIAKNFELSEWNS